MLPYLQMVHMHFSIRYTHLNSKQRAPSSPLCHVLVYFHPNSVFAAFVCFLQQMTHSVMQNHHMPSPPFSLCHSCEGARLPALSSQSSRLLAVECWEYPERKGK